MTSSPRHALFLLLLTLGSACAQDPDAPLGDAPPETPVPDRGTSRPADPPLAPDSGTSRPADPPSAQAPDLLSGGAARVDGSLRIHGVFLRTGAAVTTLWVRLLDADDRVLEVLPPEPVSPTSVGRCSGLVQLRLASTPRRTSLVYGVELVIEESRGARSAALRLPVTDVPAVRDGDRCDRSGFVDPCVDGSACAPSGLCVRP